MAIPALNALASGLDLQARRLEASADNVANVLTPGYAPTTVTGQQSASGGVTPVVQLAEEPDLAGAVSTGSGDESESGLLNPISTTWASGSDLAMATAAQMSMSGTDLVLETANQISAVTAYQAQIAAFRSVDEALQSATNIRA